MNKIILLLLTVCLVRENKAQNIYTLRTDYSKPYDVDGIIIMPAVNGTVTLKGPIKLKCEILTLDAGLTTILIKGEVIIDCKSIVFNGAGPPVEIKGDNNSKLIIEYPSGSLPATRNIINSSSNRNKTELIFKPD